MSLRRCGRCGFAVNRAQKHLGFHGPGTSTKSSAWADDVQCCVVISHHSMTDDLAAMSGLHLYCRLKLCLPCFCFCCAFHRFPYAFALQLCNVLYSAFQCSPMAASTIHNSQRVQLHIKGCCSGSSSICLHVGRCHQLNLWACVLMYALHAPC